MAFLELAVVGHQFPRIVADPFGNTMAGFPNGYDGWVVLHLFLLHFQHRKRCPESRQALGRAEGTR